MIDIDYSFIRLRDNFDDAKNCGDSPEVNIFYHDQVRLKTDEVYLQRTNTAGGISFQANYTVNVVDCRNEVLQDITSKVHIFEFSDYTGTQQIDFELRNLEYDFGTTDVYLRFESATNSEYVFWSNAIRITDFDSEFTSYVQYKHNSIWQGTDYAVSSYYQGIRLNVYFKQIQDANEIDVQYQITTGNSVPTRMQFKRFDMYKSESFTSWMQRRLSVALTCSEVYIDCVRSNFSQAMEYGDVVEASNKVPLSFLINKDYTDTKDIEDQIYSITPILITNLNPLPLSYPVGSLPTQATITFNQDVVLLTGSLKVYDSSDVLVHTFSESDLTLTNNILTTQGDLNTYITSAGNYYLLMDADLIQDFAGITSTTQWQFSLYN